MSELERNNEFTLNQLFGLIKRSGVRILIYTAIIAVVMCSVTIGVYFGTQDRNDSVAIVVDFSFQGIESGKDPLGNSFDVNLIKSPYVVNSALNALNEKGGNYDLSLQNKIVNNILVEANIPTEVLEQNAVYYPHSYRITLTEIKDLGLSPSKAKQLLNQIVESYKAFFKVNYATVKLIPREVIYNLYIATGNPMEYDYIELYDIFSSEMSVALSYLQNLSTIAPTYQNSFNGRRFSDMVGEIQTTMMPYLVNYETFIIQNGVSRDKKVLINTLVSRMTTLNKQIDRVQSDYDSINDAITAYSDSIGETLYYFNQNGEPIKIGSQSDQFDKMFEDLIATKKKQNQLTEELSLLRTRMNNFLGRDIDDDTDPGNISFEPADPLDIAEAEASAALIAKRLSELIDEANKSINEYYETQHFVNAVSAQSMAYSVTTQPVSLMLLLGVSAVVIILAGGIAILVTFIKEKKKQFELVESNSNNN